MFKPLAWWNKNVLTDVMKAKAFPLSHLIKLKNISNDIEIKWKMCSNVYPSTILFSLTSYFALTGELDKILELLCLGQ